MCSIALGAVQMEPGVFAYHLQFLPFWLSRSVRAACSKHGYTGLFVFSLPSLSMIATISSAGEVHPVLIVFWFNERWRASTTL